MSKSNQKIAQHLRAILALLESATDSSAEEPKAEAAPKIKAKPGPKPKAAKAGTLKEQAQVALEAKKFHHKSKEGATLKEFIESKVDGRSAEGRELTTKVCEVLGLPPPKKPGPQAKAKAPKAEAAPKAEKKKPGPKPKKVPAPKAEAAPKEKKAKAPKAGGTLKDQASAALEAKKFHHKSKEAATLKEFIESKVDGRSAEGREAATKVSEILGLPPPKKPGRKAKKEPTQGKAPKDAANAEAPTPSPKKKSKGASPRAIEAIETILSERGPMHPTELVKALEEKGWMPNSAEPKTYVAFILSQNKERFEKAPEKGRGFYRVKGSTSTQVEVPKSPEAKTNGKQPEAVAAPVEEPAADLPVADSDDNPFDDDILNEVATDSVLS
jgi:hypothetical protein